MYSGCETPQTAAAVASEPLMLGVRRPGVSVAQHALQQDGLISYSRGQVTILDRIGLETVVCECYAIIRERVERFFA